MRLEQLTLSEIFKVGLPKDDPTGNFLGLAYVKNLKTDGSYLVGCPTETVTKMEECKPFSLGLSDYYLNSTQIYKVGTGVKKTHTFVGRTKVVNHIKTAWVQDDNSTFFIDSDGVYTANPTGNEVPVCNGICTMNGQVIGAGVITSKVPGHTGLDRGYIVWSAIGEDCFELTKGNDAGFAHPNIGILYDILPLQDSAIVLGSRGAAQLYYAEHIFGLRDIDIPLLKSKGLCTSSTNTVLYISSNGDLIQVDKNGAAKNIGFSWIGKNVVSMSYLNGRNTFLLTTNETSYILDEHGMFSYGYKVWGEFNSSLAVTTLFEQDSFAFRTTFFDCKITGLKQLQEIYIQDTLASAQRSLIAYSETTATTQGTKILNSLNSTKYELVGNRLAIGYSATASPTLTDAKIQYRDIDRRFGNPDYRQQAR